MPVGVVAGRVRSQLDLSAIVEAIAVCVGSGVTRGPRVGGGAADQRERQRAIEKATQLHSTILDGAFSRMCALRRPHALDSSRCIPAASHRRPCLCRHAQRGPSGDALHSCASTRLLVHGPFGLRHHVAERARRRQPEHPSCPVHRDSPRLQCVDNSPYDPVLDREQLVRRPNHGLCRGGDRRHHRHPGDPRAQRRDRHQLVRLIEYIRDDDRRQPRSALSPPLSVEFAARRGAVHRERHLLARGGHVRTQPQRAQRHRHGHLQRRLPRHLVHRPRGHGRHRPLGPWERQPEHPDGPLQ